MIVKYITFVILSIVGLLPVVVDDVSDDKVKCMIQLINYTGEGAYCTVSLLDADGKYVKTLQVLGEDDEWYPDIQEWFKFQNGGGANDIDGITGASIAGGKRAIFNLTLDSDKVDAGYSLRFESAVEDQYYYKDDVVISLTRENLKGKFEGMGYIRYVRLLPGK